MASNHSSEFIEEALQQAKQKLSPWAYAVLAADGPVAIRKASLSFFEKLALTEIRPKNLRDLSAKEIQDVWLRLHQWFDDFKKRKQPVENVVNAALWTQDEMRRRGLETKQTELTDQIGKIRKIRKDAGIEDNLANLPRDIVVVPDFISVVGSVATRSKSPDDIDILVRAKEIDGDFRIQSQNVWVPIRNVLDPDKRDLLSFIPNPQGPHDDNVPLYDLVLRKKDEIKTAIVKGFPNETPEAGIHVHNLERENRTTKKDGAHRHLFMVEDGRSIWTEVDGEHDHELEFKDANRILTSGPHTHKLIVDGKEFVTEENGEHDHQLQGWSSAFDGIHGHKLVMGENTLETLLPGQYWTQRGSPPQRDVPPAPDAEVLGDRADLVGRSPIRVVEEMAKQLAKLGKRGMFGKDRAIEKQGKIYKQADAMVPTSGPEGAKIMFVGTSPSLIDVARKEPLSGPVGETFNRVYLEPLGLKRSEVAITNLFPKAFADDSGKLRQTVPDQIALLEDWFDAEVRRIGAPIIVALGKTAKASLGDRATLSMPHPAAVRKFGDRGEVARKIRATKRLTGTIIQKQQPQRLEEGSEDTRGAEANKQWFDTWHERLPKSGKGRFVYQHHWRGLEQDETKMTDAQLLGTDNSLHGDIRLMGEDGLWGWAVLIGSAKDNKSKGGDKLIAMKPGDTGKLRLSAKLQQPVEWLDIGRKNPLITKPGEAGATSEKFSKFFALDHGTYQLGVARRSSIEIFLDGGKLKGRYILQLADVEGRRFWLIDKPKDQTPTAETTEQADLISELKGKRQKFLIWSKPGDRPQKIDVRTRKIEKSVFARFLKTSKGTNVVSAVVLDPYEVDDHGDWIQPREIRDTMHTWMAESRVIAVGHANAANAVPVASSQMFYPSQEDHDRAMMGLSHRAFRIRYGNDIIHSGAWILDTKVSNAIKRQVDAGELNGYSIGGFGHKTEIGRETMPEVDFIDLTEFGRRAA